MPSPLYTCYQPFYKLNTCLLFNSIFRNSTQNLECLIPTLDTKEKTILIQLTSESAASSQNLFSAWEVGINSNQMDSFSKKSNDDKELIYDENFKEVLIDNQIENNEIDVVNDEKRLDNNSANWIIKQAPSVIYPEKKACYVSF